LLDLTDTAGEFTVDWIDTDTGSLLKITTLDGVGRGQLLPRDKGNFAAAILSR